MRATGLHVAVVGGGIFGATAAVELARHGHRVELFERSDDLLAAASGINQYRLHRGYHYPRSRNTAIDCRDSEPAFRTAFPEAVVESPDHFYAISARDSLTSAEEYLRFCREVELEVEIDAPRVLRPEAVSLSVRVRESLFDPAILRRLVWEQLHATGVEVHLGADVRPGELDAFAMVVIATYAEVNRLAPDLPGARPAYQFEICEKPVVRLPAAFATDSMVVMDGPFMCFDPLAETGLFVLGNVVHAVHQRSISRVPEVPPEFAELLNRGIVADPPITNIHRFIAEGAEYFEGFEQAEHVGSMFTIRAVLPGVDRTDERPTFVRQVDERTITVFSGKIDTCLRAADGVARLVDDRAGIAVDRGPFDVTEESA
jgi:hypothetical protein